MRGRTSSCLLAQDALEGASEALTFGNTDMAIVAVDPFIVVNGAAGVVRAEFAKEIERGGFRLGGGYFFRFNSKLARGLSIGCLLYTSPSPRD
jgi:hypothetical protein